MRGTGFDCREGVGDCTAGVVLAVDADASAAARKDVADDAGDLRRQHPAVGVAEHADLRACGESRLQQRHAVVGVVRVAVEEVLAVDEDASSLGDEQSDGVAHHQEVLLVRRPQRFRHMTYVGLRNEAHDRRLGLQQCHDLRVAGRLRTGSSRGSERHELCMAQDLVLADATEELSVLGHRAGPAALDEPHAELVEEPRHRDLVGDGVGDAFALCPVTQRRVEDVEGVVRVVHGLSSLSGGRSRCREV